MRLLCQLDYSYRLNRSNHTVICFVFLEGFWTRWSLGRERILKRVYNYNAAKKSYHASMQWLRWQEQAALTWMTGNQPHTQDSFAWPAQPQKGTKRLGKPQWCMTVTCMQGLYSLAADTPSHMFRQHQLLRVYLYLKHLCSLVLKLFVKLTMS